MLAERGARVSHKTVRRWVAKFGGRYAEELRRREVLRGRTWHLDETAVKIGGAQHWLWRAVDEHGTKLDVLLQKHRNTHAAARFFNRLLGYCGAPPERITTNKLGSYAAAIPGGARRLAVQQQGRAGTSADERSQATHGPFPLLHVSPAILSAFARFSKLFRPGRHRLKANEWRSALEGSFATWQQVAGLSVS